MDALESQHAQRRLCVVPERAASIRPRVQDVGVGSLRCLKGSHHEAIVCELTNIRGMGWYERRPHVFDEKRLTDLRVANKVVERVAGAPPMPPVVDVEEHQQLLFKFFQQVLTGTALDVPSHVEQPFFRAGRTLRNGRRSLEAWAISFATATLSRVRRAILDFARAAVRELEDKHEILKSMRHAHNETKKMLKGDIEKYVWKTPPKRRRQVRGKACGMRTLGPQVTKTNGPCDAGRRVCGGVAR